MNVNYEMKHLIYEELIHEYSPVAGEWNTLENDKDRWKHLLEHKEYYTLCLDNDATFVEVPIPEEELQDFDYDDLDGHINCNSFDEWIGCDDGVVTLLEVLGINVSRC